ncbi:unnamed protein product, partial [Ilex paraguariensis]
KSQKAPPPPGSSDQGLFDCNQPLLHRPGIFDCDQPLQSATKRGDQRYQATVISKLKRPMRNSNDFDQCLLLLSDCKL